MDSLENCNVSLDLEYMYRFSLLINKLDNKFTTMFLLLYKKEKKRSPDNVTVIGMSSNLTYTCDKGRLQLQLVHLRHFTIILTVFVV